MTGDRKWLDELGRTRADFEGWVGPGHPERRRHAATDATATGELVAEYGRYDADRARAIAEFDAGGARAGGGHADERDRARRRGCASWRATLIRGAAPR